VFLHRPLQLNPSNSDVKHFRWWQNTAFYLRNYLVDFWGAYRHLSSIFYLLSSAYVKMVVQMFLCLSVGICGLMEIKTPAPALIKNAYTFLNKEGFGTVLTSSPSTWSLGAWNPKCWRTHFWKLYIQNKRCSASCKSTREVPETLACLEIYIEINLLPWRKTLNIWIYGENVVSPTAVLPTIVRLLRYFAYVVGKTATGRVW